MKNKINLLDRLRQANSILIFGAQLVAREVAQCLMDEPFRCKVRAFVVSSREGNPRMVLGTPVIDLWELTAGYGREALIIIACMDRHLRSIQDVLRGIGFWNTLPLTFESDEWSEVQDLYLQSYCAREKQVYRPYHPIPEGVEAAEDSVHIYSVRSIHDKKLTEQYEADWEIPIQVGASLSTRRLCDVHDDMGDNISGKNPRYCELTGLYWIWKHDNAAYKGLCHYRRHFCIPRGDLGRLSAGGIDVILTVPVVNFPDVKSVYCHDHSEQDWDVMAEAVRRLAPEYEEDLRVLERSRYYYAYNMFLARRSIFDAYCEWLFPLLAYCEENCMPHGDPYQDRVIGFLAERLMSVYFMRQDHKIFVARKHFVR